MDCILGRKLYGIVYLIMCLSNILVIVLGDNDAQNNSTTILFEPESPVFMFEADKVVVNITYNGTRYLDSSTMYVQADINIDRLKLHRAKILSNTTLAFTLKDNEWVCADGFNCSLEIEGILLGESFIKFNVCKSGVSSCKESADYIPEENVELDVYVKRHVHIIDTIYTVIMVIFNCLITFGMGCKIDLDVVKKTLKKPIAPAVGFFCQFLFMPLLAFGLGKLFALSSSESIGLFANGCSPGGGASNMWTLLFNGDISLSITMTVVSTFASLAMLPFWMYTLGRLIGGSDLQIAYDNIIYALLGIVAPAVFGILLQKYKPKIAKMIRRILKPVTFVVTLGVFAFGAYVYAFIFRFFYLNLVLAGCALPWVGYVLGFLMGVITRRKKSHVITIMFETGIQNIAVAVVSLQLSLPAPQNDLSIIGAVMPTIFTSVPMLIAIGPYLIYRRCRGGGKGDEDGDGSSQKDDREQDNEGFQNSDMVVNGCENGAVNNSSSPSPRIATITGNDCSLPTADRPDLDSKNG